MSPHHSPRRRSRGRRARLIVAALVLLAAGGGCSILVSGDVPEFRCAGADPSACPSGMTCDTTTSRCVSGDAGVEPVEAGEEDASDEGTVDAGNADADAGPLELGSQCRVDSECKSELCGASTILTTTITQSTGPICTTPCCTSGECAPSFVCFNGGTGGGYCVPGTLAQRQLPASGGKPPGTLCNASSECRSGLCAGSPKRCLDTCCTDTQCASGSACRLLKVAAPGPSHDVWACAAATAAADHGLACTAQTECKSDTCIPSSGGYCRPSCSGHASCAAIPGFTGGLCRYGASGNDYFKFCQKATPPGLANGAACTNDVECQFDYCDPELGKCANVCSTDSDCASSEACRPSGTGTPFLRCVKRP